MKEYFMQAALREAMKAKKKNEVPVGCVIVKEGKIIARAHNNRESTQNAIGHAEILAITKACKKLGSWRLVDCEIYVNLEPCFMCAAAIWQARIPKLYFAARDKKAGAVCSQANFFEEQALFHKVSWEEGLYQEESTNLIKGFFKELRLAKKNKKDKIQEQNLADLVNTLSPLLEEVYAFSKYNAKKEAISFILKIFDLKRIKDKNQNDLMLWLKYKNYKINENFQLNFNDVWEKVIRHIEEKRPLDYFCGWTNFMGLGLRVDYGVLIPRPDSEILVMKTLEILISKLINEEQNIIYILELCTGSLALSLALLSELMMSLQKFLKKKKIVLYASDIDEKALALSKINKDLHFEEIKKGLANLNIDVEIHILESNLFAVYDNKALFFDIIFANPPYISENEKDKMDLAVLNFEPSLALFASKNGLYFFEEITRGTWNFCDKTTSLLFEIGFLQAEAVKKILEEARADDIQINKDFNGNDRVISAKFNKA